MFFLSSFLSDLSETVGCYYKFYREEKVIDNKKVPDIIFRFCQGRIYYIRGATLIHDLTRALSEIPTYLRPVTLA